MYIEAQYNEVGLLDPSAFEKEFNSKLQMEFPTAEILVYADGAPDIIILDVEDEDEKEEIKFKIIDIRKGIKK